MVTASAMRAISVASASASLPMMMARRRTPNLSASRRPAPASPCAARSKPAAAKRQMTTSFIDCKLKRARYFAGAFGEGGDFFVQRVTRDELAVRLSLRDEKINDLIVSVAG